MIRRFTLFIISSVCLLNVQRGIGDTVPSNEEIAQKLLVETAIQQIYLHTSKSSKLVIQSNVENSDLAAWIRQNLIDSSLAHDYSVYVQPKDSLNSALIVEISHPDITFEYKSIGSKWLFFNKGYKRTVKSNFHISVREKNGMVLLSQLFTRNFEDTLKSIKKVENDKLLFTKGEKINSSIGERLIEPVLITASAITVVYLFYSLRSGK